MDKRESRRLSRGLALASPSDFVPVIISAVPGCVIYARYRSFIKRNPGP